MDAQRSSARLRDESGSRLASPSRRAALLLAACGALGAACADASAPAHADGELTESSAQRFDRDADVSSGDGGPADSNDAGVATQALTVKVLTQVGTGCAKGVTVTDDHGLTKLTFDGFDLALPPGGGAPITKECTLRLSVRGARAYRVAELELTAGGNLALDSGKAELQLESTATWSGRGEAQRAKPRSWPGRQILDWRDHSRWTFEQTNPRCGDATSIDEVSITTKLRLTSTSSLRASGDVTSLSIEARAPKDTRLRRCDGRD